MKIFIVMLILFSSSSYALDAVITVLEAPLFESKSLEAKIVQYLRKGDIIKLHPSLETNTKYDYMAPSPEKQAEVEKELAQKSEWKDDPLFTDQKPEKISLDDEFIPVFARGGKVAYILSKHIYVYFNTPQEFNQKTVKKDTTDYRLEEPLPENYPFKTTKGLRGQFLLGRTQPYLERYPYKQAVRAKGYNSPIDLNITFLKNVKADTEDRFYYGGTLNFRSFNNVYLLQDNRSSEENGLRFGIGPTISYDAFKGEKHRLNLYGSILANLFNQITVIQHGDGIKAENREYRTINIAARMGVQYHLKNIFKHVDFVVATGMELEPQSTYKVRNVGLTTDWWRNIGQDQFTTGNLISLGGYLGLQSAY